MSKKSGIVLVVAGAVLLGAALLFALYNDYVDAKAGEASENLLAQLREAIEERTSDTKAVTVPEDEPADTDNADVTVSDDTSEDPPETTPPITAPTVLTVNGYDCIGYIEIPALGLILPVLNDWDYAKLDIAPCRQFGTVETNDLVIAGHNYRRHFAYLYKLRRGDGITFYDVDGIRHDYTVTKVATVAANDVDAVQNSDSALVLYTCTYIEMTRTAVFCEKREP